jgi:hypothetical protein
MPRIHYQCIRGKRVLEEGSLGSWDEYHRYVKENFPKRCKTIRGSLVSEVD